MSDQNFGALLSHTDIETAILDHFKLYLPSWLAARERKVGKTPGSIARPRSWIIKRVFTAIPGEESTPLISLISPGFQDPTRRSGQNGSHTATFQVGIAGVVTGTDGPATHSLIGHYAAALVGVAIKHRLVSDNPRIYLSQWLDYVTDDIDDEAQSRSMSAVRLVLGYTVPDFVAEFPVPALADDPLDPLPDDPTVNTVLVEVNKE